MNNLIITAVCAVVAILAVIAILVSQKNKKKKAELLNLTEKAKQQKPARKRYTPGNHQGIDIEEDEDLKKNKVKVKPRVLPKTHQDDDSKVRENAVLNVLDSQNHSEVDILKQTLDLDLSENVNVLNVNRAEEKVPTVLIVDDSRTSLKSATRALEKNYTIITAEDGIDALEKMQITKPDLVVTDVDMPRMTGLELVTRMKENFFFSDIPIIVVTGNLELHFQIGAHEGIDSFLPKPYSAEDLLGQAQYLLKR